MVNNRLNLINAAKIPIDSISDFEKYIVKENDILIAMSGATTGKVGFVEELNEIALLNQRVGNFKIKDEAILNKKYLYYFIISDYYQKEVKRIAGGCAQPNISAKKLESIPILVPPMEKQIKIVEKLENIEKLMNNRNDAIELLDSYINSVFLQMFGTPFINKKLYPMEKLGNLAIFKSGGTPSRKNEEYFKGDIPWITTISLGPLEIDYDDAVEYITESAIENSATKIIPKNSIIFGTRVGVGKVSINKCSICTNQDIVSLVNLSSCINNIYLVYCLQFYKDYFDRNKRGATIKGITSKLLKNLEIPVPPMELQNQFAEIVKQVEEIKKYQQESKMELENLFNNLMQKAFRGE